MTRKYGRHENNAEDQSRCIVEIWERPHYIDSHQCTRNRGHGPGGLYCKQHAKKRFGDGALHNSEEIK